MNIAVAAQGTRPLAATYDSGSSPAQYDFDTRECTLHRSIEWKMASRLDLEIEYTIQVLTHEQLHECVYQQYQRYIRKRRRNSRRERLIHKGDFCALMGF